jgi:hypothetical protein
LGFLEKKEEASIKKTTLFLIKKEKKDNPFKKCQDT